MEAEILKIYKPKLIQVLKEFISICTIHNLNYFCCGGTALGAVRHNGIIPWDDDIDIIMPRPDYDKFLALFESDDYVLITPENTNSYYLPYSKMSLKNSTLIEKRGILCNVGIFIDIFPLDGISKNENNQLQDLKQFYKIANKIHRQPKQFKNNILDGVKSLKNRQIRSFWLELSLAFNKKAKRKKIISSLRDCMLKYDYAIAEYVSNYAGMWGIRECCPKIWFEKFTEYEFEGILVRLPAEPHHYLTRLYGNYMELPPVEKRTSHHVFAYINLEKRLTIEEIKALKL